MGSQQGFTWGLAWVLVGLWNRNRFYNGIYLYFVTGSVEVTHPQSYSGNRANLI